MMIAGIGGGARHGSVALAIDGHLVAALSQEAAVRVRGAGVNASGVPDEALGLLLERTGRSRSEVTRLVAATATGTAVAAGIEAVPHERAHASTAYRTSPFAAATVIVCDDSSPDVTVWTGDGGTLRQVPWRAQGPGFAPVLHRFATAFGFRTPAGTQRLEALARLQPDGRDPLLEAAVDAGDDGLRIDPGLDQRIADRGATDRFQDVTPRARAAAALQSRLGDLVVQLVEAVHAQVGGTDLCLGGTLFYNSSINTRVRQSGVFERVFVPVDPGDSGLGVGAALEALGRAPAATTPFLGPGYSAEETKAVLDNCKLQYDFESEEQAVREAVQALGEGHLVGWFEGGMEWGPRALGARSILASPTAPYVLENLNRFLKHREPWRGYALSCLDEGVAEHFDGPASSPFMECEYRPRDAARFREVLPSAAATVRVQTVGADGLPLFRRLLEVWGERSGVPCLVNTSFNGFHEPVVCTPRDAVRVFYGSGLDVLIMNQFVLRK